MSRRPLVTTHAKKPLTRLTSLELLVLVIVLTLLLLACLYPRVTEPERPDPILLAPRTRPRSISPPESGPA